ncbi:hypothetical protein [Glycomyces sp. YM15]|uniref:hypothetical protein n=1 Tax=Glycomyces sp. YM15 TaxID=2800446 RepID=UPI001965CD51|nr:hypothetical protein [Glycomyces sp. YM15]
MQKRMRLPGAEPDASLDTAAVDQALRERPGWILDERTRSWTYTPSTPPARAGVTVPDSCFLRPTELDLELEAPTAFPPSVVHQFDAGDPPVLARDVTGLDDTHLAERGLVEAIDLPTDVAAVVALLPHIESWRWPDALPTDGFGPPVMRFTPFPAEVDELRAVMAERPAWVVEDAPYEGDPLVQMPPRFTHTSAEGHVVEIRPLQNRPGFSVRSEGSPAMTALEYETGTDMLRLAAVIEKHGLSFRNVMPPARRRKQSMLKLLERKDTKRRMTVLAKE